MKATACPMYKRKSMFFVKYNNDMPTDNNCYVGGAYIKYIYLYTSSEYVILYEPSKDPNR